MRALILAVALMATIPAQAQQQMSKNVMCAETQQVLEAFQGDKYKEILRWSGTDLVNPTHTYVLLVNEKTGTFTFIEMNSSMACVLGTGTKPKFYDEPGVKS